MFKLGFWNAASQNVRQATGSSMLTAFQLTKRSVQKCVEGFRSKDPQRFESLKELVRLPFFFDDLVEEGVLSSILATGLQETLDKESLQFISKMMPSTLCEETMETVVRSGALKSMVNFSIRRVKEQPGEETKECFFHVMRAVKRFCGFEKVLQRCLENGIHTLLHDHLLSCMSGPVWELHSTFLGAVDEICYGAPERPDVIDLTKTFAVTIKRTLDEVPVPGHLIPYVMSYAARQTDRAEGLGVWIDSGVVRKVMEFFPETAEYEDVQPFLLVIRNCCNPTAMGMGFFLIFPWAARRVINFIDVEADDENVALAIMTNAAEMVEFSGGVDFIKLIERSPAYPKLWDTQNPGILNVMSKLVNSMSLSQLKRVVLHHTFVARLAVLVKELDPKILKPCLVIMGRILGAGRNGHPKPDSNVWELVSELDENGDPKVVRICLMRLNFCGVPKQLDLIRCNASLPFSVCNKAGYLLLQCKLLAWKYRLEPR